MIAIGCLLAGMLGGCLAGVGLASTPAPDGRVAAASSSPPAETKTTAKKSRRTKTATPKPTRTTRRPAARPTTKKPAAVPDTDPRYGTCAAAKRAGLGPYRRGVDREYGWYEDRDGDGTVCE
ncbi:excalibur calcium-binding domain-containing protein [Spirillospora sp. CA-255316]